MAATTNSNSTSSSQPFSWVTVSYATLLVFWALSQIVYIPFVLHLLTVVTAILYASCHASLKLLGTASKDGDSNKKKDGPVSVSSETMKQSDAMQFPIMGSLSLFSLYLAFKFLDKEVVNFLIGGYFLLIGCAAITLTVSPAVETFLPAQSNAKLTSVTKALQKLPHWLTEGPVTSTVTVADLFSLGMALIVSGLYFHWSKPWFLNNILGISFCLQGIERFSLGTYKIGAILLVGLFFYDIFWVFGTEVMVSVAKNLDGPIKLLFPRGGSLEPKDTSVSMAPELSLLGLGDIVIPGFFLALLLRFDAHRAGSSQGNFAKPYFLTSLAAYVAGLGMTLFIMFYFDTAQPALLYLVPACLGSSLLVAVSRGEVKELLAYSEEAEEEEDDDKKETSDASNQDAPPTAETNSEIKKEK